MANSVMTHAEDDGTLSIVVTGSTLIVACEHGHYWVLESPQYTKDELSRAVNQRFDNDTADAMMRNFM